MESRPSPEPNRKSPVGRKPSAASGGAPHPFIWLLTGGIIILLLFVTFSKSEVDVNYSWFRDQVKQNNIKEITFQGLEARGVLREKKAYQPDTQRPQPVERFVSYIPTEEELKQILGLLDAYKGEKAKPAPVISANPPQGPGGMVFWLTPALMVLLLLAIFFFMMRRARDQFDGGILGNFVKAPAKKYDKTKQRTTFDEVAGLENAKAELQEIVEFLKNPEKFQRLGGKIPKGVLLNGPPGTGKTLLARAVAGEAGVQFHSISGSEFIQMFVGVGASRVRDMFKTAKENSPCILFIDEIDAVGRVRGAGLGGGHDEREQTLNQILTEMDGFSPNESVIVLAATNRPDVLDPALLRPGRFDRHVTVDLPTKKGRVEILKVHTKHVPLASDVDLDSLARSTVGMSGADLANLVNEAALLATREDKEMVDRSDFEAARDKVLMGAKREEVINEREKRATAYHEVGHALVGWFTPNTDPVHKVTIIPRGRTLGVTQFLPEEDRLGFSESQLLARLTVMMGGRAAEKLVLHDLNAGAANDLEQASRLARRMVAQWGMSDRIGPVAFRTSDEHPFLGREMSEPRDHSEHTAQLIDEEVARILREADERAYRLLEEHRDELERMTEALVEREVLNDHEIEEIIGPRVRLSLENGAPAQPAGVHAELK